MLQMFASCAGTEVLKTGPCRVARIFKPSQVGANILRFFSLALAKHKRRAAMPHSMNRRHFIAGTAGLVALHPFSVSAATNQAHLRLMETTDLHVHVFP